MYIGYNIIRINLYLYSIVLKRDINLIILYNIISFIFLFFQFNRLYLYHEHTYCNIFDSKPCKYLLHLLISPEYQ